MNERICLSKNGQWELEKWSLEKRCWEGYKPTPGKKAYDKGSCEPVSKKDIYIAAKDSNNKKTYEQAFSKSNHLSSDEFEITQWEDGEVDITFGNNIDVEFENTLVKTFISNGYEELNKKEWQAKAKHKSEKGGLTAAGRESYNKATGGHLQAPQPGGGPRKRSFCARNKGQIDMHNIDCKKTPDKRACKARRRWKCN